MVDPKMVEFNVYNGIPHLLVPVVTDVKKAAGALQWAVVEMMKRYSMFSEKNARDLEGYNAVVRKSGGDALPQVVVVIDELADLMMMAAKEVEESICRVAQMGRAAGVHLVIATQSPRADVITGLMKANIPSRIALKVASALESRIILDAGGNADKLVGNGDMLYAPIGSSKPMRLQGTWVSDAEREDVVTFIKKQSGRAEYSEEVMGAIEKASEEKAQGASSKKDVDGDDYDELLPQAADVIFETGQASVSILQRRLKLGYSRAARIVDQLEELGVVGPFEGSKPRAMLITREEWMQRQYINGTAPTGKHVIEPAKSVSDE
jgi:S-DNA-T family DNA segregation ATPase FtsK/SpoIIIE